MAKKEVADFTTMLAGLDETFMEKKVVKFGDTLSQPLFGLQVPSIAFQYLLGTTGLPLSRVIRLGGSEGSYKSTFMYEMMRWFVDSGGGAVLLETEAKDSEYIRNGVMQWDESRIAHVLVQSATTYQQWVSAMNSTFEHFRKSMESSGNYYPLMVSVDSITAVATEESLEKMSKEGVANVGFPDLPKHLSEDLRKAPANIAGFPFTFLFVNHMKPDMMNPGPYSRGNLPGGKALGFYNSLTLILSGDVGKESADGSVHSKVRFKTYKNSNGREGRSITVDLVRWSEPDPSDPDDHVDYVAFDWGATDISFLLSFVDSTTVGSGLRTAVKELLGLHMAKVGTKHGVWSEPLGIPKEAPVVFTQAGALLHQNKELMSKLQNILLIRKIPIYTADLDYKTFISGVRDENRQRLQRLQKQVVPPSEDAEAVDEID